MRYAVIPVTPFEQNCCLIWCEQSNEAAVVDPGGDLDRVLAQVEHEKVDLKQILIPHAHIDHAGGAAELSRRAGVPIVGPQREDQFWIDALPSQSQMFGFPQVETFQPERWLEQGDRVMVGQSVLEVRHCPGHTPGHVIFYQPQDQVAIVGDVLFHGSIGRTDFPRGDHAILIRSIREQLLSLDDSVQIISGHGPTTTIGEERRHNPFLT